MATTRKRTAPAARKAAKPARGAKSAKAAAAPRAARPARAAKSAATTRQTSADMDFVMNAFKTLPPGTTRAVFSIVDAGPQQSARMGVALFEQMPPGDFQPVTSQDVDNLPMTPAGSKFAFAPRPGANYVITFSGEMHSLSTATVPLQLTLAVTAEPSGATVEDFNGPRSVNQRACSLAGRALLRA